MGKKVSQYSKDNKLVKIWDCVNDVGRANIGFSPKNISFAALTNGTHKGYYWRYE
jgi:hypothetical protein